MSREPGARTQKRRHCGYGTHPSLHPGRSTKRPSQMSSLNSIFPQTVGSHCPTLHWGRLCVSLPPPGTCGVQSPALRPFSDVRSCSHPVRAASECSVPSPCFFLFFFIYFICLFSTGEKISPPCSSLCTSVYLSKQPTYLGLPAYVAQTSGALAGGRKMQTGKKKCLRIFFPPSAWIQELSILSRRVTCWGREQKSSLLLRHTRQGTCLPLVPLRAHPTPEARGGAPETQLSV